MERVKRFLMLKMLSIGINTSAKSINKHE